MAVRFKNLDGLINANEEELAGLNDIGGLTASYIVHYFKDGNNLNEISSLIDVGVKVKQASSVIGGKLNGLKFVLTGTLPGLTRSEASKIIEENGGEVLTSVSKNTDYVLAGADAGSKLIKAQNLKIRIINEEDFLKMI